MVSDRKLGEWEAAGVIDGVTAERIRAHEAESSRPVGLWAAVGLGLFAIALGVINLVAANWDLIHRSVKLGGWALIACGLVWALAHRARWRPLAGEILLAMFGAFILAGIGLVSQVYQLSGPVWQAVLLWVLIAGPAVLVAGGSRITAYGFGAAAIWLGVAICFPGWGERWAGLGIKLLENVAIAIPIALIAAGAAIERRGREEFGRGLTEAGLVVMLAVAALAHFLWAGEVSAEDAARAIFRIWGLLIALGLLWWFGREARETRDLTKLAALAVGPTLLAFLLPHPDDMGWRLFGAVLFMGQWGAIAWLASERRWRGLFGVAITAIALRLFIIYVELFGGLAATGWGLLLSGLLLLALTFAWARLMKRWKDWRR